jgi:hypothetical protein
MKIRGVRAVGRSRVASNLWRYGFRTATIILRTFRDFWPLHFFGWISMGLAVPGAGLLVFLLVHRVRSGRFFPHIWSGFTGAGLIAFGGVVFVTGLVAEMLKRIRLNQEAILYYHKRRLCEDRKNTQYPSE